MRYFYAFTLSAISFSSIFGQNSPSFEVENLQGNSVLRYETSAQTIRQKRPDSIQLPFLDDFSNKGNFPSDDLWLDKQVFVNATMAGNPPSVGIATFDGINAGGAPYGGNGDFGACDTLTSNFINLRNEIDAGGTVVRTYTPADSIYLSFFVQPKGLCYAPLTDDSLVVEFKNTAGTWEQIWSVKGFTSSIPRDSVPPFKFYIVPISQERFLYGKFQFRFRNFGRRNGNYTYWHVDYVKIAKNRRFATANQQFDMAFGELPPVILSRYTSMPWRQAKSRLADETQNSIKAGLFNQFQQTRNITSSLATAKTPTLTLGSVQLDIGAGLSVPNNQYFFAPRQAFLTAFAPPLSTLPDNLTALDVTTEYVLQTDDQEDKDLLKAAFRNDTVRTITRFSDYFAYDDGSAEMQFTATGFNTRTGLLFKLNVADTLRGVRFFFPHINNGANGLFNLRILRNVSGTWQTAYEKRNLTPFYLDRKADTLQGFTTYRLETTAGKDTAIALAAGDFIVEWQNVEDIKIPIGLDRNNRSKSQYLYQYYNGSWRATDSIPGSLRNFGALMVRPVFSKTALQNSASLSVKNPKFEDNFRMYPNPAQDILYIEANDEANYQYTIMNLVGQSLAHNTLNSNSISVSDLPNGVYILKLQNTNTKQIYSSKFFISK